jgi:hypothetical protein
MGSARSGFFTGRAQLEPSREKLGPSQKLGPYVQPYTTCHDANHAPPRDRLNPVYVPRWTNDAPCQNAETLLLDVIFLFNLYLKLFRNFSIPNPELSGSKYYNLVWGVIFSNSTYFSLEFPILKFRVFFEPWVILAALCSNLFPVDLHGLPRSSYHPGRLHALGTLTDWHASHASYRTWHVRACSGKRQHATTSGARTFAPRYASSRDARIMHGWSKAKWQLTHFLMRLSMTMWVPSMQCNYYLLW